MGSMRFRIPPALSSVLAALGTLQLRAVGFLNRVDPLVSSSNYYIVNSSLIMHKLGNALDMQGRGRTKDRLPYLALALAGQRIAEFVHN